MSTVRSSGEHSDGRQGRRALSRFLIVAVLTQCEGISWPQSSQPSPGMITEFNLTRDLIGLHLTPRPYKFQPWTRSIAALRLQQEQKPGESPPDGEEEEEVVVVGQPAETNQGSRGTVAAILGLVGGVAAAVLAVLAKKQAENATTSNSATSPAPVPPRLVITPGPPVFGPPPR